MQTYQLAASVEVDADADVDYCDYDVDDEVVPLSIVARTGADDEDHDGALALGVVDEDLPYDVVVVGHVC